MSTLPSLHKVLLIKLKIVDPFAVHEAKGASSSLQNKAKTSGLFTLLLSFHIILHASQRMKTTKAWPTLHALLSTRFNFSLVWCWTLLLAT